MTYEEKNHTPGNQVVGYEEAFYELAKLMDIPAQDKSPREVWESQMLPKLREALSTTTRSGGWIKVPAEPPLELLKSINQGNQVLAYENGRYYNAWFEFEMSEGGWFWRDDADTEPNPSHYRPLMEAPTDV